MGFLIRNLQTSKMQLSALRVFKTPEMRLLWSSFLQKQALTGFLQNNCSKQERQQVYLKSTSPWMFSSCKTLKGKNKDFARQNKFSAMPMPMPMLMLMTRCQCRYFQMAFYLVISVRCMRDVFIKWI